MIQLMSDCLLRVFEVVAVTVFEAEIRAKKVTLLKENRPRRTLNIQSGCTARPRFFVTQGTGRSLSGVPFPCVI